ncbi:MAG: glycosyltransferase family 4 protein [Syntrophomonadaceae bacterium]|nr:glycosyltransferase family 4 protein [Syntrophomonadaceae bacterium]
MTIIPELITPKTKTAAIIPDENIISEIITPEMVIPGMINSDPKILMVTPLYRAQRGNSITVERLKKGLQPKGFSIDVVSLEDSVPDFAAGAAVDPAWLGFLQNAVREKRYALMHGFHGFYFGKVLEAVPEIAALPLLLTTTGTDLHYYLSGDGERVIRNTFKAVKKIVLFNEAFRARIRNSYPELSSKLVTIPQGIDLPEGKIKGREDLGWSEDDLVFFLPSGFRVVKNLDLAINALMKIQPDFPQVRLLIVGAAIDPDYTRAIEKRLRQLPWVRWLGEIPHAEMKGIIALADIVLNTSYSEGQPQGALEAMSLGKPAILSAVPGNLNLMTSGVEGFYVSNEEELMAAARTLISNQQLREKMGRAAQKLVESEFSLKKELTSYAKLYDELLHSY